jgi:hypothetical protein
MKMRTTVLAVVVVPLIALFMAQTAAATERHHTRAWAHAVAAKQFRSTNAFGSPSYVAVRPNWSNYSEAAQTSGLAGH